MNPSIIPNITTPLIKLEAIVLNPERNTRIPEERPPARTEFQESSR